jgi:hypothetical protein
VPVLRTFVEPARTDARFVAESLVPALARAGFRGVLAVQQREPDIVSCVDVGTSTARDVADATVTIAGTARDIEALLLGKARAPSTLERLKARGAAPGGAGAVVRGTFGALEELARAAQPRDERVSGGAREIGAEAGAPSLRRKRDRMKLGGRYIKGVSREMHAAPEPVVKPTVFSRSAGAPDPVSFGLANLGRFVAAGVARADERGAALDDVVEISAAGARVAGGPDG